jgi:hypothetical protein
MKFRICLFWDDVGGKIMVVSLFCGTTVTLCSVSKGVILPGCMYFTRTPENQPKCIIPGPGKFLRSEGYICANLGKFRVISDKMYVLNLGISSGSCEGIYHNPGKILIEFSKAWHTSAIQGWHLSKFLHTTKRNLSNF